MIPTVSLLVYEQRVISISRCIIGIVSLFIVSCSINSQSEDLPKLAKNIKVKNMPVLHDNPGIFKQYSKELDSKMNNTWTRKFDASGISMDKTQTCTLVTPSHVVMAAHYQRSIGDKLIFHDRHGKIATRYLIAKRRVLDDCAVGRLNAPLPAQFTPYPILKYRAWIYSDLMNEYVILTDKSRRLFVHQVAGFKGHKVYFYFDEKQQIGYGKMLIAGDSGNPSFVMVNGKPALLETHSTGGPGAGPFYGDEELQNKLVQAIKQLGGVGMIKFVNWPRKLRKQTTE